MQDVFEMKYAHTPMESSSSSVPPRSEPASKPDVKKTVLSVTSVAQGRKEVTGDGDESEEERERRLHELQEQASVFVVITAVASDSRNYSRIRAVVKLAATTILCLSTVPTKPLIISLGSDSREKPGCT